MSRVVIQETGGDVRDNTIVGGNLIQKITGIVRNRRRESIDVHTRTNALRNVRELRVEGQLHNALRGVPHLGQRWRFMPDRVADSWTLLQLDDLTQMPERDAGTSLLEILERRGRSLLVLGEPGSGKTVALLGLADALLARAEDDPNEPVPLVLDLSSWRPGPTSDWIAREAFRVYQIPPAVTERWLADGTLTLLLDGLDEIADPAQREECARSLTELRKDRGIHLLVSSRTEEYDQLRKPLDLADAVLLEPLEEEQIDHYLGEAEMEVPVLRRWLRNDPELRTLARSPLFLSTMARAFEGANPPRLEEGVDRRSQVLEIYIRRRLQSTRGDALYDPVRNRQWLAWFAHQTKRHGYKLFFLDLLQPSWLSSRRHVRKYALGSRFLVNLAAGAQAITNPPTLLFGSIQGLLFGLRDSFVLGLSLRSSVATDSSKQPGLRGGRLRNSMAAYGSSILSACVILGLFFPLWLASFIPTTLEGSELMTASQQLGLESLLEHLVALGLLGAFGYWLLTLPLALVLTLPASLPIIGIFGIQNPRRLLHRDIPTVQALDWSTWGFFKGALLGALVGAITSLGVGIQLLFGAFALEPAIRELTTISQPVFEQLVESLVVGGAVLNCALTVFFGGVTCGLRRRMRITRQDRPGHRSSAMLGRVHRVVLTMVAVIILISSVAGLAGGIFLSIDIAEYYGFGFAVLHGALLTIAFTAMMCFMLLFSVAPFSWAYYGGSSLLQRWWLVHVVSRSLRLPAGFEHFLENAVALGILRRVGPGYTFVHEQIRDQLIEGGENA